MGLLQNIAKGIKGDNSEFKERLKDIQMERKAQRIAEDREKSANERELERLIKREREDKIKEQLNKIRKKENKEMWKSNSILKEKATMMKNDRPILKEKNIFKHNQNLFSNQNSMGFFK